MDAFKEDQTRIRGVNEDFHFNLITIYLHARYKTFVLLVIAHLLSVHTYRTKLLKIMLSHILKHTAPIPGIERVLGFDNLPIC